MKQKLEIRDMNDMYDINEYETLTIIEYDNRYCTDLLTETKSQKVAINRFFRLLEKHEDLYSFKDTFIELLETNGYIESVYTSEIGRASCRERVLRLV